MPPIDNSDTPKEDQIDHTRWGPRNKKPTLALFCPRDIRYRVNFVLMREEEVGKNRKPDDQPKTGWYVPHVQGIQKATNLQCVPKRLHDTTTGKVRAMSDVEGRAFEYATVSHVWDMSNGIDWLDMSQRIGKELSVPYVWVDKTCINQEIEEEKGQEIKRMAEYYTSAKHNVILLSKFSMAAAINAWKEEGMRFYTPAHKEALKLAGELVDHSYFTRVWTMQELELARHNVLLLEDGWVDGHDLDNLLRSLTEWDTLFPGKADIEYMFCNCQRRKSLTSRQWQMSVREPLIDVWWRAQGRRCTNPNDVIWGMISLVKGGDRLKSTYDDALSDVLAELLALENCLGEVLMIREGENGLEDNHTPCWQPRPTGLVPSIVADVPRMENMQNVQFTLDRWFLGANAYLLGRSLPERSHVVYGFNPMLGGEKLLRWPCPYPGRHHNRLWFVPIWRTETFTKGVVLLDLNSEGNEIHKVWTMAEGELSAKALALVTATKVWIGGP